MFRYEHNLLSYPANLQESAPDIRYHFLAKIWLFGTLAFASLAKAECAAHLEYPSPPPPCLLYEIGLHFFHAPSLARQVSYYTQDHQGLCHKTTQGQDRRINNSKSTHGPISYDGHLWPMNGRPDGYFRRNNLRFVMLQTFTFLEAPAERHCSTFLG